ncbi:hypothetical protein [Streptomyces noursei]|uniref:hypothetical protein n=1 Tax=Streptomyces noursei TaxID=1971 RepID=UPI001674267A|nr:hypothetical protein [Streptomyces noursei]MCZ1021337.1 hypothetical protein [Streptomyces noursei]GGX51780.1 hypothetical protein GCM10010341_86540 [Streptomyces noursei]
MHSVPNLILDLVPGGRQSSVLPWQGAHGLEGARRLRSLREGYLRSVIAEIGGRPKIALYVLVKTGGDPAERLAMAQSHADREGFDVVHCLVDDTWMTEPSARPGLARAYAALRLGEIHGLVAASRVDVSSSDQLYEQEVRLLHGAGGFLALALDECRL